MTKECEYCGQQVLVPNDSVDGWEMCRCAGARIRQRYESLALEGDELIDEIFNAPEEDSGFAPVSEYGVDMLRGIMREVAQQNVGAVTVGLPDGSKAAMRINGSGELEISRSKRRKIANSTNAH